MWQTEAKTFIEDEICSRFPNWIANDAARADWEDYLQPFTYTAALVAIKSHRANSVLNSPIWDKVRKLAWAAKKDVTSKEIREVILQCIEGLQEGRLVTIIVPSTGLKDEDITRRASMFMQKWREELHGFGGNWAIRVLPKDVEEANEQRAELIKWRTATNRKNYRPRAKQ